MLFVFKVKIVIVLLIKKKHIDWMYTYIYTNIYINLFLMYGNVMLEIEEQAINKHIYYLKCFYL